MALGHPGPAADDHVVEAVPKPRAFGALALQQRDLLGVFAHPHQVEAEIGLVALLIEIEPDQRRADPLRQHGAEHSIHHRAPYQITWDRVLLAEQVQRRRLREAPQDHHEGRQRHRRTQQLQADIQRPFDEQFDVVGDALVRVVGGIALQLHAVVIGALQPFAEIVAGQPAPPADLEPLVEIELVDRECDEARRQ